MSEGRQFNEFLEAYSKIKLFEYISKKSNIPIKIVGLLLPSQLASISRIIRNQYLGFEYNIKIGENLTENVQFVIELDTSEIK